MIAQTAIPAFPEVRHTAAKDRSLRTVRRKTNPYRSTSGLASDLAKNAASPPYEGFVMRDACSVRSFDVPRQRRPAVVAGNACLGDDEEARQEVGPSVGVRRP